MAGGDCVEQGTFISRKQDQNGNPVGHGSANPKLNTRMYNVESQYGYIQEYLAITIAKNTYEQGYTEGNEYMLLQEICNYWKDL